LRCCKRLSVEVACEITARRSIVPHRSRVFAVARYAASKFSRVITLCCCRLDG
jgi:hypothetical protein